MEQDKPLLIGKAYKYEKSNLYDSLLHFYRPVPVLMHPQNGILPGGAVELRHKGSQRKNPSGHYAGGLRQHHGGLLLCGYG